MSTDELNLPKNRYIVSKEKEAKKHLAKAFDEYKEVMRDRTHPKNQTATHKKIVQSTIQRLLSAADNMDSYNPGEGIFGLIVLCLRMNIQLRDDNIILEHKVKEIERELKRLKKQRLK